MEFVGKILVLLALAGIAAIEVYHKEENTGLMNLILVLIAAVVGWLLPKNDHVLSMIAAVASFAALYPPENRKSCRTDLALQDFFCVCTESRGGFSARLLS